MVGTPVSPIPTPFLVVRFPNLDASISESLFRLRTRKRTDQPPMFLDPSRQRHLFANLGTRRRRELDLGKVTLDAQDASASGRRPNVDQQQLVLCQLGHLGLFLVFCAYTEKSAE